MEHWSREDLRTKNTKELEELLREDAMAGGGTDLVLAVLPVLQEREGGWMDQDELDRAWQAFQTQRAGQVRTAPNKRKKRRRWMAAAIAVLILTVLLAVPAAGDETLFQLLGQRKVVESAQIQTYSMATRAEGRGELRIQVFVEGKGTVTRLGMEEVVIQRREPQSQTWVEAIRYDGTAPGLQVWGQDVYGGELVYWGRPGTAYQITLTAFAENEAGYDSRTETVLVTAE